MSEVLDPKLDPFGGITGAVAVADIKADKRLKIALVGKQKSGKSWFAATAPPPILFYDFDDRAESLEKLDPEIKKGIKVKTLRDIKQDSPIALKAVESDLSTFKYKKTQGQPIPATFVFDSVTYMKAFLENEIFSQESSLYKIVRVGAKSVRIGKNWDIINGVERYLQYLISEFAALGNVIFIFHERPEKDVAESTLEKTAYTDKYTVDPQYLAKLLSTFNEVYRIEIDSSNKYAVTCNATHAFTASTSLLIDNIEQPDIMKLIEKHRTRLAAKAK